MLLLSKMISKEIPVKDIKIIENSRTRTDESDVSFLMRDIKQHGLLHPIGVYADGEKYILLFGSRRLKAFQKLGFDKIPAQIMEKLSEQDLLLVNSSENLHREDLKPHEVGRICIILQKQGLNYKEIATRLGLTEGRVRDCMSILREVPKELLKDIQNVTNTRNVEGKLSVTTVGSVLGMRTSNANKIKLLKYAKTEGISNADVRKIGDNLRDNRDFDEAVNDSKNSQTKHIHITLKKKQASAFFKSQKITLQSYAYEVLKGQRKPNTSILF